MRTRLVIGLVVLLSGATLAATAKASQMFRAPMNGSHRLDWCLNWGTQCGAAAAHAFCEKQGLPGAMAWQIAPDIGDLTPTRTLGDGKVCEERFCDGFASIRCGAKSFLGQQGEGWTPERGADDLIGRRVQAPREQVKRALEPRTVLERPPAACGPPPVERSGLEGARIDGNRIVPLDGYRIEKLDGNQVRIWKEAAGTVGAVPMGDAICGCIDCDGYGCYANWWGHCNDHENCSTRCAWLKKDPCASEGFHDPFDQTPGETIQ